MTDLLLRNGLLLDVVSGEYAEADIRCADGRIAEVGRGLRAPDSVPVVDVSGSSVLPGLIDGHVHVAIPTADTAGLYYWPQSYVAFHAGRIMSQMLDRGFTTVRDVAGADYGLALAQEEGLVRGPRLAFGGKGFSATGGHGDHRSRGANVSEDHRSCSGACRLVDGVDALRIAARDELRKGAHHIKVMASGGIASPTDRIDSVQYSMDELRAVVDEAAAANRYVAAHVYTAKAVNRAVRAGIRSIEHGNLLDEESVQLILDHDAFLVPNLVTYWALQEEGRANGLSETSWRKVDEVFHGGLAALELASRAGVKLVYGTDLLGDMHRHQSREFLMRREVQQPIDIIRAATCNAADLLRMPGEIGTLTPGAHADIIVVDGDPLADIGLLADPRRLTHIVQAGNIVSGAAR